MPELPKPVAAEPQNSTASLGNSVPANPPLSGRLIINADDWGGWLGATDAILACFRKGRVTSASAMVFMEDSERGARLADDAALDVGLHINLNQVFSDGKCSASVRQSQERIRLFLKRGRYAQLWYHPFLRREFREVFQAQWDEFHRLYGRPPSHLDGHRHMHLCANMLWDGIIPRGQKVRRSFSFWPGEKSSLNRAYRSLVDHQLKRRYRITDYFFALSQCLQNNRLSRIEKLATVSKVELMTHPEKPMEYEWLMSTDCLELTRRLPVCSYGAF